MSLTDGFAFMRDIAWAALHGGEAEAQHMSSKAATLALLDKYTRRYFESESHLIGEVSPDVDTRWRALLETVNTDRKKVGLGALEPMDYWDE